MLALTVPCPQVDVVEGSLMGLPGERGPVGPKGVKVCGWSERRRAAKTTGMGQHHELGPRWWWGREAARADGICLLPNTG